MFQKLINLLKSGKTYSQYELARELNISPDTLRAWIEHLVSCGLVSKVDLQQVADYHGEKCGSCVGCRSCSGTHNMKNEPIVWELNMLM